MDVRARRRNSWRHDACCETASRIDRAFRVMMTQNDRSRKKTSIGSMFSLVLSARHDSVARILNVDLVAVLVAALLPWSTSGVAIVMIVWLVALVYTLEVRPFLASLRRPACMLPIALVVLAAVGTLWSD